MQIADNIIEKPIFYLNLPRFTTTMPNKQEEIFAKINASNRNHATKSSMESITEYLKEKQLPNVDDLNTDNVSDILTDFYTNLRKVDGENYKLQSIKCIRARVRINSYMKANKGIDVVGSDKFVKANEMFQGVEKQLQMSGLGSVASTPSYR